MRLTAAQRKGEVIRILKAHGLTTKVQYCETSECIMYHKSCFHQLDCKLRNTSEDTSKVQENTNWKDVRSIHLKPQSIHATQVIFVRQNFGKSQNYCAHRCIQILYEFVHGRKIHITP